MFSFEESVVALDKVHLSKLLRFMFLDPKELRPLLIRDIYEEKRKAAGYPRLVQISMGRFGPMPSTTFLMVSIFKTLQLNESLRMRVVRTYIHSCGMVFFFGGMRRDVGQMNRLSLVKLLRLKSRSRR